MSNGSKVYVRQHKKRCKTVSSKKLFSYFHGRKKAEDVIDKER
jgi:hypothetical protein